MQSELGRGDNTMSEGLYNSASGMPIDYNGSQQSSFGKVLCYKHPDKEIEYFCKICHAIVCPKCMFTEHNGHDLAQLEDVTSIIKQNIYDLNKLLLNTKRISDDNRTYIVHQREEVVRLKEQQMKNIDKGFSDLIRKLEEKRDELKADFTQKYLNEENKIISKNQILDKHALDI
jgi:hypothetical protein